MSEKIEVPADINGFLYWIKAQTEAFWTHPQESGAASKCPKWARNAKWIGLEDAEIDAAEQKYQLKFTPDHRAFLRILHTLDKAQPVAYYEDDSEEPKTRLESFFHDWRDEKSIRERLNWVAESMIWSLEQGDWLDGFGEKPETTAEQLQVLENWLEKAPKLIPIFGHRFIISEPCAAGNPILSVYGLDAIVYGWDLRDYLLNELKSILRLKPSTLTRINQPKAVKIPFWEDILG
jgi:hypothetical protein